MLDAQKPVRRSELAEGSPGSARCQAPRPSPVTLTFTALPHLCRCFALVTLPCCFCLVRRLEACFWALVAIVGTSSGVDAAAAQVNPRQQQVQTGVRGREPGLHSLTHIFPDSSLVFPRPQLDSRRHPISTRAPESFLFDATGDVGAVQSVQDLEGAAGAGGAGGHRRQPPAPHQVQQPAPPGPFPPALAKQTPKKRNIATQFVPSASQGQSMQSIRAKKKTRCNGSLAGRDWLCLALSQLAIPLLCDLAHGTDACRKALWVYDGLSFYLTLLGVSPQPCFLPSPCHRSFCGLKCVAACGLRARASKPR